VAKSATDTEFNTTVFALEEAIALKKVQEELYGRGNRSAKEEGRLLGSVFNDE